MPEPLTPLEAASVNVILACAVGLLVVVALALLDLAPRAWRALRSWWRNRPRQLSDSWTRDAARRRARAFSAGGTE